MYPIEINVSDKELIDAYNELKSSYKVAKKYNTSATAVKRILKSLGVLRTQKEAATERTWINPPGKYKRKPWHIENLRNIAKKRMGKLSPAFKHGRLVGKTDINSLTKADFDRLKKIALPRDKYSCYFCKSNAKLIVHHRIPRWLCPDAILDIDNTITVCRKCHLPHGHNGNWHDINFDLIPQALLDKYKLDRERLSESISYLKATYRSLRKESAIV